MTVNNVTVPIVVIHVSNIPIDWLLILSIPCGFFEHFESVGEKQVSIRLRISVNFYSVNTYGKQVVSKVVVKIKRFIWRMPIDSHVFCKNRYHNYF